MIHINILLEDKIFGHIGILIITCNASSSFFQFKRTILYLKKEILTY